MILSITLNCWHTFPILVAGDYHQNITIEEDSTGKGYSSTIGVYFSSEEFTEVSIDEPYIKTLSQVTIIHYIIHIFNSKLF